MSHVGSLLLLALVRHGELYESLKNSHGEPGEGLTATGRTQVVRRSRPLKLRES